MMDLPRHPSLPPKPRSVHPLPARPSSMVESDIAVSTSTIKASPTSMSASSQSSIATTEGALIVPRGHDVGNANPSKRKLDAVADADSSPLPAENSGNNSVKPQIIPLLPTPLPSKRFKKGAQVRSLLIPVEQLPVYALPTLPVITDPKLEKQVFQHQSLFEKTRGRFEDPEDQPAMHYEKLEHVGDSILGMIVTTWLQETKPLLTCGTASKLKSHLVSNATLSHISGMYNLPSRLKGDPNQLPVLRAQTDVRAAMVEAYIAALYFSHPVDKRMTEGLSMIDAWLRDMYEPLYDFFYTYMKSEYDQHRNAVGENEDGTVQTISDEEMARIDQDALGMAALIKVYGESQERKVHYGEERYETNLGILWRIKVSVDGIELGQATRANKKTAKNVAALEAARALGLAEKEQ